MFYSSKQVSGSIFGDVRSNIAALGAPRRPWDIAAKRDLIDFHRFSSILGIFEVMSAVFDVGTKLCLATTRKISYLISLKCCRGSQMSSRDHTDDCKMI